MLPILKDALEAREARIKDEKFKQVREAVGSTLQNDGQHKHDNERYLLACLDAKSAGIPKADYLKAGEWLRQLNQNYNDANQPFLLHAEDLARLSEANPEAAKYILNNPLFCNRICPEYLARIAESNEALTLYVLGHPTLCPMLDAFDLARLGAASLEAAKIILSHAALYEKLEPWCLAWIGESSPECAKLIFAEEKFTDKLDPVGITKIATRYKPIGKFVIETEKYANRLSPDQLQRLKAVVEK